MPSKGDLRAFEETCGFERGLLRRIGKKPLFKLS
jgi:hypothetical protein